MKKTITLLLAVLLILLGTALAEDPDAPEYKFMDTWVDFGFSAEFWYEEDLDDAFICEMALNDNSFTQYVTCIYDEEADALLCSDGTRFYATYNPETVDYDREIIATDLTAVFTIVDDKLYCEDSEGLLKDVVFLRLDAAEELDALAEEGAN
ncbi:MAG: hypothetical protein IJH78_06455 [Clostridia bacterium]|nr:hypothetical protein [Clostridia bacterium]